jgi:PAS domain S-box-containing protein
MVSIERIPNSLLLDICDSLAEQCACAIAIFDQEGAVLAASARSMIGARHREALAALLDGEEELFANGGGNPLPEGHYRPLRLEHQRCAVFGIIAPQAKAQLLSAVACGCAELLLTQQLEATPQEAAARNAALELSEARFRDFANTAADWFWEMGADLRFCYLTGRVQEVMGLKPEQILGRCREEIYANQDLDQASWQIYQELVAQRQPFSDLEVLWRRPDGGKRHISLSGKPILDHSGNFRGYRGVGRDISEQKRQQEEVTQLRNYLINVINSMPSVLIGVDTEGRITQWNNEAWRVTGIPLEQAIGQPLVQVFPRLSNELGRINDAIRSRRKQIDPKRAHQEDGETHFENVTIYPLVTNGVDGAVIRLDDVTDQVRMEEMMIQSEKMLSVGGLAAGMAHEINNPLAAMIQTANVMRERLTNTAMPANLSAAASVGVDIELISRYMQKRGVLRMLEGIGTSGQRAAEIVDNMLTFARKSDAAPSSHDLSVLMEKALELAATDYNLKQQYDFKSIEIVRDYADNIPQIPCEGAKIQQVLLNILRNGAEAMQESAGKNPSFIIRTRYRPEQQMALIEIEDNGPGIDAATRRRIFEPFFTTKPVGVGTGLGLSVSYFIIKENHGGELSVESTVGKGSRFIVQLPLSQRREQ